MTTLIGHRCCPGHGPENTVLAARRAVPHVDMLEIDVRRCGSGELVVIHDETLDRVTGTSGRVEETSLDRLRELGVQGTRASVPTLVALLEAIPADVPINVELKESATATDALSICSGEPNRILFSSFSQAVLRGLRERAPSADLAVLTDGDPDASLALATAVDAAAVHPSLACCSKTSIVDRATAMGLWVNAWTIRTRNDRQIADACGVDGIIADRWDLA